MYHIHTNIKKYLHLLILSLLVSLSTTLQAAVSAVQSDAQESYDYTLQNHADQVSPIQEETYLDIEEMPRELTIILKAVSKDHHDVPQLLAMVAEDMQNSQYYKYLFASNGLLADSQSQQKAHNLNYHLVKAHAGPVIWQVLSFLDQKSYLEIKGLMLPKDTQLCLPCGHMCMHLFGKKLPVHKAGCQAQPFPTTAAPTSAIACFYSDRFTGQQQRLVISQIGDQAFSSIQTFTAPTPVSGTHKPAPQPIQPAASQNQLHMAVQLQFSIQVIRSLLSHPHITINALDSSGKTPLDYATEGSNLYLLLVGHDAKTSQELKNPVLPPSTSHHSKVDQAVANKDEAALSLPAGQLLIPANGQCLYTTIIMGYLLPVRQVPDELNQRVDQLFGMQPAYYINQLHQTLENPTHYLTYLHSNAFGTLTTAFMARIQIKKGTWGGPQEIQTIATKLKVNIQEYYPDPSKSTITLLSSDLTKPSEAVSAITLHIVRDKVHPAEVLTQAEKASAKDNPHYQHYRLKYTLPSSSPAPVLPSTQPSNPTTQILELTEAEIAHNLTPNHSTHAASAPSQYSDGNVKEEQKEEALHKAAIAEILPIPKNLGEMKIFPTPYEYALLSHHVYRDDIQVGDQVDKLDGWSVCAELDPENNLLTPLFKALGLNYGYRGRIYKHSSKRQMVLAHRGTEPTNLDAFTTDVTSIVQNDIGGQERLTIDLVETALANVAQGEIHSLSFTGHSLGGWLAQISLFVFFDQKDKFQTQHPNLYKKLYVKAVTFDTPGARAMLKQMNSRNDALSIDHLDITNYLSSPNLINCCNSHIGTLYRVVFKQFSKLPAKYTQESHTIKNFVAAFDPHTKDAKQCLFMRSWPKLDLKHLENRFSNLLTLNKGKIILYALLCLKDFLTDEPLLAKYQPFFKLAQETTTHVNPQDLTGIETFYMEYKYHYKSCNPDYARFHLRHISHCIYERLNDVLPTKLPYLHGLEKLNNKHSKGSFTLDSHIDSRLFLDALMQKGPYWLEDQKRISHAQKVVINTSVIAAPLVDIRGKSNLPALPHNVKYIIKREATLEALHTRLQDKPTEAIIGYGGVGKSTLARLYAGTYFKPKEEKSYYDHVWWFRAEDDNALKDSIAEICRTMGIKSSDNYLLTTGMQQIKEKLQADSNAKWLLIFDNVREPQKISKYLIQGGHILITSRNSDKLSWDYALNTNPTITNIECFSKKEAIALLNLYHKPTCNRDEKKAQEDLLGLLDESYPLALSQIGHCIRKESKISSESTLYQNYYQAYKAKNKLIGLLNEKKLPKSAEGKTYINRSIVVTFENTLDKIKKEMKNKDKLVETLRILRVVALLHPDGLDWCFLQYLRRSRRGDFFKKWFQDRAQCIKKAKAKETVACLREYGLLLDQGVKCRTHRTIQAIMQWKIANDKNKNLITYIEDQALELLETIQQQMNEITHLTIDELRFSVAAHCHTLMKHLTHDGNTTQDKEKKYIRLLHVMSQIDQLTYLKDQKLYLPPQAIKKGNLHHQVLKGDLHHQVLKFINTTYSNFSSKKKWFSEQPYTPLLLIQGDAGTGKSCYASYLAQQLWEIHLTSNTWAHIPLFISLPEFCTAGQIPPDIIEQALVKKGLNKDTIQTLKKRAHSNNQPWFSGGQPWVFIFDGYDEIHGKKNLFTHCNLKAWGIAYSKYIITCRTTYLAELNRPTLFKDHNNHKAEKLEIAPYARDQIDSYVDKFATSSYNRWKDKGWNDAKYKKALKQYPELKRWMTTPFFLVVGLQALPRIAAAHKDADTTLSLTTIYNAFVEEWLDREEKKPHHKIKKETLRTFCEELGYTLWKHKTPTLTKANKTMISFFEKTYALQSAPLRYLGNNRYMFIHKDFQDFFAASFIIDNIAKHKLTSNPPSFSPSMKAFLLHYKDKFWSYLRPAQQVPSIAASNSIRILYSTGHRDFRKATLTRLDLSDINLANAKLPKDLSFTIFSGAILPQNLSNHNLTYADLSYTNLINIKLSKNLSYTIFSGAILPQNLSKHHLTRAHLSYTNLTNVKLPQDLFGVNFTYAKLPKDLSNHTLAYAHLNNTNLTNVKLPKDLSNTNLSGAILPEYLYQTNLSGAMLPQNLSKHDLIHANLSNTNLTNVKLPKNLFYTNLSGATLPKDLSNIDLYRANLSNTNLTNVKLPKDLSYANLSGATLPKDLSSTSLRGATLPKDLSKHILTYANLSNTNLTNVKLPKDLSNTNLSGATLPKDLSNTNLTHSNLTGQRFTITKFEGTQLEGAILTNTLCDYQQCFQDHIKANKLSGGKWYQENLPKDLKSISQVYPRLSQDSHKVELLQIASRLAYLPYWEDTEFYIKVQYWSCKLLLLKKQLSNGFGEQLVCALAGSFEYDARNYCWDTDYPQDQVEEAIEAPHDNFDQYLKTFQSGLQQYNCKSKNEYDYNWYKDNIEKNIHGLQKTYPKLTSPTLQKEAIDITFQLSTLYQHQHLLLLFRYLSLQNRLIQLKISAGVRAGNEVHYNSIPVFLLKKGESRGKAGNEVHYNNIEEEMTDE